MEVFPNFDIPVGMDKHFLYLLYSEYSSNRNSHEKLGVCLISINMRNILILLLISSAAFCEEVSEEIEAKEVNKESETEVVPKRHHEDDMINEKIEQYIKLLEKKRNAIDKFLTENYSDFNHSDYTPEVPEYPKLF